MWIVWFSDRLGCNILVIVSAVKDPVSLRHFGKREVLAKIDLMENWYDIPLQFDLDCIPANTSLAVVGEEVRSWGYGVAMFGAARGHRREVEMPSLMADMYGFVSE